METDSTRQAFQREGVTASNFRRWRLHFHTQECSTGWRLDASICFLLISVLFLSMLNSQQNLVDVKKGPTNSSLLWLATGGLTVVLNVNCTGVARFTYITDLQIPHHGITTIITSSQTNVCGIVHSFKESAPETAHQSTTLHAIKKKPRREC